MCSVRLCFFSPPFTLQTEAAAVVSGSVCVPVCMRVRERERVRVKRGM